MSNFTTRLGSANTYDAALRNLGTRQSALSSLQENLTSGKRVNRPSDDPTAAAQAERSRTRIERIKTDQRALDAQRNAIAQAESTLGDVTDALQSIRELVVSAGNAGYTHAERLALANQINGLRDQVFALSNRKDTNGLPLFSALGSALEPFVGPMTPPQDYTFQGLPGQSASSEVSIPFALNGQAAFMHQPARDGIYNVAVSAIPNGRQLTTDSVSVNNSGAITGSSYQIRFTAVGPGATPGTSTATYDIMELPPGADPAFPMTGIVVPDYPSSRPVTIAVTGMPGMSLNISGNPLAGDTLTVEPKSSLFSVLDTAVRDIGLAGTNNAATQAVSQALANIDAGMAQVAAIRGQAGDLLNRVDRISANQEKRSIQLESDRSTAEDLDMIKGVSDFQNQQTGFQAALQSYAQVQKLSLFNFLG